MTIIANVDVLNKNAQIKVFDSINILVAQFDLNAVNSQVTILPVINNVVLSFESFRDNRIQFTSWINLVNATFNLPRFLLSQSKESYVKNSTHFIGSFSVDGFDFTFKYRLSDGKITVLPWPEATISYSDLFVYNYFLNTFLQKCESGL